MAHILLIEDERDLASFVERGLREEGHRVSWADTGAGGLDAAQRGDVDLVLLDLRLPDLPGLEVCRTLRERRPGLPILMITALDSVGDRVAGLRGGADDYLPKPFAFVELLARIEALLRRVERADGPSVLRDGDLVLDRGAHVCRYGSRPVDLTPREFELLAFFLQSAGRAVTRDEIHRAVWGLDFNRGTNLINVYVNYVRARLREAGCPAVVETVRGVGYRFVGAEGGRRAVPGRKEP